MILSLLEYTALRVGVVPRPQLLGLLPSEGDGRGTPSDTTSDTPTSTGTGGLLWSGIADGMRDEKPTPQSFT